MPHGGRWAGSPFCLPPTNTHKGHLCEERKTSAATGPPFLWTLSFGGAKESVSPSGARTRLKVRRDSDTTLFICNPQKVSAKHQLLSNKNSHVPFWHMVSHTNPLSIPSKCQKNTDFPYTSFKSHLQFKLSNAFGQTA